MDRGLPAGPCPVAIARLPLPGGPVVVGQSIAQDRDSRYFGLVQSIDDKPKRRLHEILREQGLQMNQDITFLTDGGDTVRGFFEWPVLV